MPRVKKEPEAKSQPAWLITFSDLTTLLLTFFVLLISMAVFDKRRQLVVVGSIINVFGQGGDGANLLDKSKQAPLEPGPMEANINDLRPLSEMVLADSKDLDFQSNKVVQVVSVSQQALFEPGQSALSAQGRAMLARMTPTILKVKNQLLLTGHTGNLRDELTEGFLPELEAVVDPSWMLSLRRTLSVYHYFIDAGADPAKFRMEAFGRFRPRHGDSTPEARRRNSSVDIVLSQGDRFLMEEAEIASQPTFPEERAPQTGVTIMRDFDFEFKAPIENPTGGQSGR